MNSVLSVSASMFRILSRAFAGRSAVACAILVGIIAATSPAHADDDTQRQTATLYVSLSCEQDCSEATQTLEHFGYSAEWVSFMDDADARRELRNHLHGIGEADRPQTDGILIWIPGEDGGALVSLDQLEDHLARNAQPDPADHMPAGEETDDQ